MCIIKTCGTGKGYNQLEGGIFRPGEQGDLSVEVTSKSKLEGRAAVSPVDSWGDGMPPRGTACERAPG